MELVYSIIPKILPAREKVEYEQRIPRIIWQTMKTSRVPVILKDYANTWIQNNPEYDYRFYDDDDIIEFLKKDFPDYLEAYNKIKYGASKADLWRYLIIYKYGGVYSDLDCRCINPLRDWVNPLSAYVTQLGENKDFCQWLIISVPQNPIFLKAAQKALQNIEHNSNYAEYYGFEFTQGKLSIRENHPLNKANDKIFGLAGTPVLQESAEECFREGSITDILPFIQIVCVSGTQSCQMKGNVAHDSGNADYIKAISRLKTPHYNRFTSRMIRKFMGFLNKILTLYGN
jgi:hypothetical protein